MDTGSEKVCCEGVGQDCGNAGEREVEKKEKKEKMEKMEKMS